jgi:ribosomal protein S18 acetylase RimI-like enzyme
MPHVCDSFGTKAPVLIVAESSDDGIVGVDGELMALYVLESQHGNGFGRRLTVVMARRLADNGRTGMMVWVLADNPAPHFYERLGGGGGRRTDHPDRGRD